MPKKLNLKTAKEVIKRGRRTYGAIYELFDGREVYIARRKFGEVYREGRKSVSQAIADDVASWAIDDDHCLTFLRRGVVAIGVHDEVKNQLYLTPIANFFDPSIVKFHNYRGRGGSIQRKVPVHHFRILTRSIPFK